DEQAMQVVAGLVFVRATAEPDDGSIGENDLKAENVVAGDAVLEAARPAGVGGNVAADEIVRAAGGIGRIKQTAFLDGLLQFFRDDAGFNDGDKIGGVDFLDAIHAFEREYDAAAHRHTAADVAVARAARR